MKTKIVIYMSLCLTVLLSGGNILAADISWGNASGGNFTNGANWGGGSYPSSSADAARFDLSASYTVDITETITNGYSRFRGNNQTVTLNIASGMTYKCGANYSAVATSGNKTNSLILTGDGTWAVDNVLVLGHSAGDVGSLLVDGGNLSSTNDALRVGQTGTGYFTLTNGTADMKVTNVGQGWGTDPGIGFMNIWGGSFTSKDTYVLGTKDDCEGTLNMYGGLFSLVGGEMRVGQDGTGTVNMVGGVMDCSGRNISVPRGGWGGRGVGYLNIQGGSVTCNAILLVNQSEASTPDDISHGTVNLSGGSLTANGDLRIGIEGTGTVAVSGGTLSMPTASGVRVGDNSHSNCFGRFDVIGTNGTIDIPYYRASSYTNSETRFFFADGGVSTIECRTDVQIYSGALILGMRGYMDMIPTTTNVFICGPNANDEFTTTNRSIFSIDKSGGTEWVATPDNSFKAYASVLSLGASVTATNKGWFDFNTNEISGATFDIYFRLVTNGMSGSLSDLIAEMQDDGHATATNMVSSGSDWLKVTYSTPTWSSPRFGFDFSGFDANLKVDSLALETIPRTGSIFMFF